MTRSKLNARSPAVTAGAEPIAIIGMAGRFPGARDTEEFWTNLAHGIESIAILSQEEMRAAGVPEAISKLPGYVNASPVLDGVDQFDAEFFGFSARDAALTDPQHRLFLETAWQALEDAGYDPGRYAGSIGVFGGCELSSYLYHLYQNLDSMKYIDGMQLMVTNDKDHLCTQISYRMNLRGPSVAVQTTCSTSLVAVGLACESLQHGRCDIALAGGVTVKVPQRGGYFYTAGSILSPDGHCRPFDAKAQGTIVGSGSGLVVLKRLKDALADGDRIRAQILGVGINNDGNDKVGYTAPSSRGQAAAIRAAHRTAGITAESIGYVEAHGTGTILGDPIELSALTEVFRESTEERGFCGIGSAKSNFGHLSCAAGVAGLIKAVLTLENQAIPPTVHYSAPNPAIDLVGSPFYVTTRLTPWERNGIPRRAGISSFGVGGTNAHVVLEEAPATPAIAKKRAQQVFTLSARSEAALAEVSKRLAKHLRTHSDLDLADAAFTLHVGRRAFKWRRAIVAGTEERERLAQMLERTETGTAAANDKRVVFMFPGQGSQFPGMAAGLYQTEPVVKRAIDRCVRLLKPALGTQLRKLLFPLKRDRVEASEALRDTKWAQPALFTVGYALGQLWTSWGIKPAAMIGHSVGEYVAATLAGVMSLEDALKIIALRGQLISSLPRGSMFAVMGTPESVERFLGDGISVAAVNAPGFMVLSGPDAPMAHLEEELRQEQIPVRRLHTSHAFHSSMMDPILEEFEEVVGRVTLGKPKLPFVSTLTGTWAGDEVATASYWSRQLRSSVLFADGLRTLMRPGAAAGKEPIWLEAGPGTTLSTFAREVAKEKGIAATCLPSLAGADGRRPDSEEILTTLGQLWANGVELDWQAFHGTERCSRVSLPTYPFERQSYWVGTNPSMNKRDDRDPYNWFYRQVWREEPLHVKNVNDALSGKPVLVIDQVDSPGAAIAETLRSHGCQVTLVHVGDGYAQLSEREFTIDPNEEGGFRELAAAVCSGPERLAGVIDCLSAARLKDVPTTLDAAARTSLMPQMRLAQALSRQTTVRPLPFLMLAAGTARIDDGDALDPYRALSAGVARVIPQEYPGLRLCHIDIDESEDVPEMIAAELAAGAPAFALALRKARRFVEAFDAVPIRQTKSALNLPPSPVVMVTGGLGHMGMHLAEGLFARLRAKLVLVGRAALPPPEEWAAKAADAGCPPQQKILLERLNKMRDQRDDVMVALADLNDAAQVQGAVDAALERFGAIDMVIHGAARIDAAAFGTISETDWKVVEAQFSPKLRGLENLMAAMKGHEPARWILHSSIAAVLGGLALGVYAGANAVLDAIALQQGPSWLSIDWDAWDNAAEAQSASLPSAIQPREGSEALLRLLGHWDETRALVVIDLAERLKAWVQHTDAHEEKATLERHPRPSLTTALVEPRNETEATLAEIWSSQLGLQTVGVHDRFFDLGGHSLLAAQIAAEICDRFQIELPVLKLFQAPTVAELAVLVDEARAGGVVKTAEKALAAAAGAGGAAPELHGNAPEIAAKASYRDFYNDVTRRLEQSGMGAASFFLNYGYVSLDGNDEAQFEIPPETFNRNSVRLALELIGSMKLQGKRVLDVGCGRGGTAALLADAFGADAAGVDLAPEAIAFCRKTHGDKVRFEVGDAEHLPFEDGSFDAVTNMESSHTYPNLRAFFGEVKRVLAPSGVFLYTDLLPVTRWAEVQILLGSLGFRMGEQRNITANVLASCDEVAANRTKAFGGSNEMIDNFLAVPGSAVYEQMDSGAWEYRILRAVRS